MKRKRIYKGNAKRELIKHTNYIDKCINLTTGASSLKIMALPISGHIEYHFIFIGTSLKVEIKLSIHIHGEISR